MVYTFLPDEKAHAAALLDGSIDVARLNPRLAQAFRDNPDFQVVDVHARPRTARRDDLERARVRLAWAGQPQP